MGEKYLKGFRIVTLLNIIACITISCRSVKSHKQELPVGIYKLREDYKNEKHHVEISRNGKVIIEDVSDTIFVCNSTGQGNCWIFDADSRPLKLKSNSFDIDLFTIPFRIRPGTKDFPTQINTSFNIAMYTGFRKDFYKIASQKLVSGRAIKKVSSQGVGFGSFAGLSLVAMNPFVSSGHIDYEYEGVAITYGLSGIYAFEKINAGLAIGFDYLTDRNNKYWIYHNKPWIGILLGLNIN